MRLFGGKGLIAGNEDAFYDVGDGWVPLAPQRRPRYAPLGTLQTPVFDGREPGCVWHRLMLDGCVPPDASLRVRSRAADEESQLAMSRWQREPDPYLRRDGSEFPLTRPPRDARDGTWELLFQRARGRYLQVELTLSGNERATPRIRALRAYYPRFSYLQRYLPAVYREDEASASFLDRFLANLEGFNTTIEDRMAAAHALLDVRSAPAGALDWLASWFGVALDPAWNEAKRRLFIRHAPDFFRQRGTAQGVQNAIRLAIDDCVDSSVFSAAPRRIRSRDQVRIVENYRTRRLSPLEAGDATEDPGPREIPAAARWRPTEGRTRLSKRYRDYLAARGLTVPAATEFPVRDPQDGDTARLWRAFSREVLGFVPSATVSDLAAWQAFLARRYRAARTLQPVYGASAAGAITLPDRLPPDGRLLRDWFDFESTVMAVRRSAHRFSVLLPLPRSRDNTEEFRRTRLDLVRRVVDLEKPAHTVFDVKFYWALFRLGAARLGDDTLVYRGGRDRDLLPPLRLGEAYLAESHLEPGHPQNVDQRFIVGRDPRDDRPEAGETRA
jgi:phage tail-like protein